MKLTSLVIRKSHGISCDLLPMKYHFIELVYYYVNNELVIISKKFSLSNIFLSK